MNIPEQWAGNIPVFLVIIRHLKMTWPDGREETLNEPNVIDLDEKDWATTYSELMRSQATWHLVSKEDNVVHFSLFVRDGEQPYYVARHFRNTGIEAQISAYGIGKKRLDGHVDRLWVFTDGQVCGGDDVDFFGQAKLTQAMG